jgi:glucose/mannose transport system substrate-binding protein
MGCLDTVFSVSATGTALRWLTLAGGLVLASPAYARPTVEVLYYWTSGSESQAAAILRQEFEANGGRWIDAPVAGGGGDAASTVLRTRLLAGNPPGAVQLKGPNIQEWAAEGVLADLDDVAGTESWRSFLPPLLQDILTWKGHFVAVPINIHRVDWLWINPQALARVNGEIPKTWSEFNALAEKLLAAGIIPLAHGGQPWQDATLFENVVLGLEGPAFYRRALIDLDRNALQSDAMIRVFDEMRTLSRFVDEGSPGRDWNLATGMLIDGKAAMQIMGDWTRGELMAASKEPGKDILCTPIPGKAGYILNSDSFVMLENPDPEVRAGQKLLAKIILGRKFQETFNLKKGSIPARLDVPMDKFDSCALQSNKDLKSAIAEGTVVPSLAHEMAVPGEIRGAFLDVITSHFNSDMTSEEAVKRLVEAIDLTK